MTTTDFTGGIPAGTYLTMVSEVRSGTTIRGTERWALRLVIVGGQFHGRQLAWDTLVLSTRGKARAGQILEVLGLERTERTPGRLLGRRAFVEARVVEYSDPAAEISAGDHRQGPRTIRRLEVPYDGWHPDDQAAAHDRLAQLGDGPQALPVDPAVLNQAQAIDRERNPDWDAGHNQPGPDLPTSDA
jgi:hypothetical protein